MSAAVVFDVDDTLYLERDYVRSGFSAVDCHLGTAYGVTGFFDAAWQLFKAGHRGRIFNEALEGLHVPPEAVPVRELVEVYRAHDPDIRLLPDSATLVRRLQSEQVPIGIITDGPAPSQHAKIDALGLREVAATVIVTADLGPGLAKPNEAAFLGVQEELSLQGDSLVYVADNPSKDFVAPNRLAWRTLRIRRPGSLHHEVASGPDVQVELPDLLHADLP